MAMELVVRKDLDALTIVNQLDQLNALGATLLKSGLMPRGVNTPEKAVVIILKGRELGLPPMAAINGINVIAGKPTVAPQMMLGLVRGKGLLEKFEVLESTDKVCKVHMKRKGGDSITETFTIEDAQRIKTKEDDKTISLCEKHNWKSQPKVMLRWRCIAAVCRLLFPDVLDGIYLPEELGADFMYSEEDDAALDEAIIASATENNAGNVAEAEVVVSEQQLNELREAIKKHRANEERFCQFLKIQRLESLPATRFDEAMRAFGSNVKKGQPKPEEKPAQEPVAGESPQEENKPSKSKAEVLDFLKTANIAFAEIEGKIVCKKAFKNKAALTSIGFTWSPDQQGFVFEAA